MIFQYSACFGSPAAVKPMCLRHRRQFFGRMLEVPGQSRVGLQAQNGNYQAGLLLLVAIWGLCRSINMALYHKTTPEHHVLERHEGQNVGV